MSYAEFRTGLMFRDVYHMLATRKYRRRHGVLGYWRQLKLEMWEEYQRRLDTIAYHKQSSSNDKTVPF